MADQPVPILEYRNALPEQRRPWERVQYLFRAIAGCIAFFISLVLAVWLGGNIGGWAGFGVALALLGYTPYGLYSLRIGRGVMVGWLIGLVLVLFYAAGL